MRKTKQEKAITLIALIITIVVLLILAVVAINSITNDELISKAEQAANKYNESVSNEATQLQNYVDVLNQYANAFGGSTASWTQSGTSVTNGKVTLTVGQTVTGYDSGVTTYESNYANDDGWAVLGAENGKLLLVSRTNVQLTGVVLNGATHLIDADNNGKVDGIDYLNSLCDDYLNTSLAEEVRSITVEDINRVTGYNPAETGDGKPFGDGNINKYGNKVTYTLTKDASGAVTGISWTSATNSNSSTSFKKFMTPDGKRMMSDTDWNAITDKTGLTREDSVEVTSNYYYYYPSTLTTSISGDTKGIATNSPAHKVLFNNTNMNSGSYWLASTSEHAYGGYATFGLRAVHYGYVNYYRLWNSDEGSESFPNCGARAVVSLKSGVQIDQSGNIS